MHDGPLVHAARFAEKGWLPTGLVQAGTVQRGVAQWLAGRRRARTTADGCCLFVCARWIGASSIESGIDRDLKLD